MAEHPEIGLWRKCEDLWDKFLAFDPIDQEADLDFANQCFKDLYDLARDLSDEAADLRQQVESLEADDNALIMEDAIRDVLAEYPNLVRLKQPLLRKLHDAIAPGGLI